MLAASTERRRLHIQGLVQGVGFRPFVHRLGTDAGLSGYVLNDGEGVVAEVEGPRAALESFQAALVERHPQHARIDRVDVEQLVPVGGRGFEIRGSTHAGRGASIPPDIATCGDCLRELFDPANRRHRYPFVNCTRCGPRFSIVTGLPYDRRNTTMARFRMCDECTREYEDPGDRRFHAEPIACPECGPRLTLPLAEAVDVVRGGGVLAVKGLGGYHLACDATSEAAVARLRERKHREERPLAVMTAEPSDLAEVSAEDEALLDSPAAPIVLIRQRPDAGLAPSVAPGAPELGLMRPYTPLHHLLLADVGIPIVLTSGNVTDEPIAVTDEDAQARLGAIADAFLSHDRPIHRRCEDSVVRIAGPLRRSRGYAPARIALPVAAPRPLVAAGAERKSTFCVAVGADAVLSPHLGDLDTEEAYRAFTRDLDLLLDMLEVEPGAVACDLHPDYRATRWAWDQGLEVHEVQHHHAHAAACLAEHGEAGPALAVVLDGTGYGTDGTLWGGEVLRCDLTRFDRVAWLEPVPLPGGEAAIREPWRVAGAYLELAGRPVPWERWSTIRQALALNAPRSSGAGRLFDSVAALLGVRERSTYEGQAAIELEHLAGDTRAEPYECSGGGGVIRGGEIVAAAHDDLAARRPRAEIAAAVHEGVAAAFARACAEAATSGTVVLSGGALQNQRLAASLDARLRQLGFRTLRHRRVPPNDGGVSVGQAAVAAARMSTCA